MTTYVQESQKFTREAAYIIDNMDRDQLINIVKDSFNKSMEAILISKKNAIKNTGKTILRFGMNTGEFIKNEINFIRYNPENYIDNLFPRIKYSFKEFKDTVINTSSQKIESFKELSDSGKKDIILSGLLWVGTVLMIGGGADFEGGAPDLDSKLGGIGRHRNVFSHTILLGLSLEFFIRFTINLLRHGKNYLPDDRSKVWIGVGKILDEVDRNENVLVSGAWIGLSIHLLKDANIGSSKVKPYVGMPKGLSMETHQNIFAGNSFLAFIFGKEPHSS